MTNIRLGPHASHRRGVQDGEGRSVSAPLRVVGLEWYPTASIYRTVTANHIWGYFSGYFLGENKNTPNH
jgi:hypothetical protein